MDVLGAAASLVTVVGGVAGAVAWRRRRSAKTQGRAPVEAFELLPYTFRIDLFHSPPSAEVELYAINYTGKRLQLTEVKLGLYASGAPGLAHFDLVQEFTLFPRSSMLVTCRRNLTDTEASAIALPPNFMPVSGAVDFVARARTGRREFVCRTEQHRLRIEGGIQPPAG